MLRYTITLPPAPAIADLAAREATIGLDTVNTVRLLEPVATTFQFDTEPGVAVDITLVDIDTSGNRSAPSPSLAFVASDTVPPPVPGQMAVGSVEQIDTPPPATKGKP